MQEVRNICTFLRQYFFVEKHNKSISPDTLLAAYRDGQGNRCSIGCLFDDSIYQPKFEGCSAESLINRFPQIKENMQGKKFYPTEDSLTFDEFLVQIQKWHDQSGELNEQALSEIEQLYA